MEASPPANIGGTTGASPVGQSECGGHRGPDPSGSDCRQLTIGRVHMSFGAETVRPSAPDAPSGRSGAFARGWRTRPPLPRKGGLRNRCADARRRAKAGPCPAAGSSHEEKSCRAVSERPRVPDVRGTRSQPPSVRTRGSIRESGQSWAAEFSGVQPRTRRSAARVGVTLSWRSGQEVVCTRDDFRRLIWGPCRRERLPRG